MTAARTLKRTCRWCGLRSVVEVLRVPQPNASGTAVQYVRDTRCTYCGGRDA